jgi:protease I
MLLVRTSQFAAIHGEVAMQLGLKGHHVAILAAEGVDAAQLGGARRALADAGASADVLAAQAGQIRGAGGEAVAADQTFERCRPLDYDALIIPGGRQAMEALSNEPRAVQFVKELMAADKPVAAIDDGMRLLIAADTVAGRTIAATPELADELRRAGAELVDAPLHVDEKLITASRARDIGELNAVIVREFANRVDEARVDELSEQSFPASDPPPGPVAVGGEGASTALHLDSRTPDRERGPTDGEARS